MARNAVWTVGLAVAVALGFVLAGGSWAPAESAEHEMPQFVVGDVYAFVGLEPQVVSGVVLSVGPSPWVEVKVDNIEANIYHVNLDRVTRFKHVSN